MTGDMVSRKEENLETALHLTKELTVIVPVYFSYGNHEWLNELQFGCYIGSLLEEAGAIVMDYVYQDVEVCGEELRIEGIYGYCLPEKYLKTQETDVLECRFLKEFQDTERRTLLLAHMPYAWQDLDGLNEWDIDMIFAGHSHGGQIELPLLGPVLAPDQGWFPEQTAGKFVSEDGSSTLIVSRGLGDWVKLPRVNNPWEMIIVDIR